MSKAARAAEVVVEAAPKVREEEPVAEEFYLLARREHLYSKPAYLDPFSGTLLLTDGSVQIFMPDLATFESGYFVASQQLNIPLQFPSLAHADQFAYAAQRAIKRDIVSNNYFMFFCYFKWNNLLII